MVTRKALLPGTYVLFILLSFSSCSVQRQIDKTAKANLVNKGGLVNAHIGISIFDPATNKYLYNFQGDKYFVPASNTKIFSCYVGMKYLGDSLPGIMYHEDDTAVYLFPTADPSLLHKDFLHQPVIDFLQRTTKAVYITDKAWKTTAFGSGWAWNDFNEAYMPERSPLPVYGNLIRWIQERTAEKNMDSMAFDQSLSIYSLPEVNWKVGFNTDLSKKNFFVQRSKDENIFEITEGIEDKKEVDIPFVTNGVESSIELLEDTVYKNIVLLNSPRKAGASQQQLKTILSQPTDSILKPMMHRSDNFFAEQVLLMASNARYGVMDEDSLINSVLKTDLVSLPQRPRWVDGSGLSRYNIFTPQSFVSILNKMKLEFSFERIKSIFPTAGTGTLSSYPKIDSNYIFGETGTVSGVVALSGFLITQKRKVLIFSILINHHRLPAAEVRRQMQVFLTAIRKKY